MYTKKHPKYIITAGILIFIINKFLLFFFIKYKNERKEHKFNDKKKKKKKDFYSKNENIFNINDIDINKILVSKTEQYGKYNSFKYFIGYNDNDVIRPLYLFISFISLH